MADALPFGVGGPAEPEVPASPLVGNMIAGLLNIPKHLIDAASNATPGLRKEDVTDNPIAAEPNQPLYNASADTALGLAGTGAPAAEAGAAGIFGGKLAKTADLKALQEAVKMREMGEHPDRVLTDTGWFRSPADSKWRFEIPDNQARMLGHGQEYSPQTEGNSITGPANMMMQHPELWKAYPQLGDMPLQNSVQMTPQGTGLFDNGLLSVNAPNLAEAKSVGLHELQHGVQDIEHFAVGGNPNWMSYLKEKEPTKLPLHEQGKDPMDLYRRLAGEVEARNVQTRAYYDPKTINAPWQTQDTPYQNQLIGNPSTLLVSALRRKQ